MSNFNVCRMSVGVQVYAFIYLCMYISVDLCMYLYIYASMSVCMSVTYVGMYVGPSFSLSLFWLGSLPSHRDALYTGMYVCMSVCMHVCMHVGIYVRYVCIARTGMSSSIYGWFEHNMDNVAVVGGLHRLVVNLIISNDPKHQNLVETYGAIFVGRQPVSRYNWSSCLFQLKPQLVQKTKMSNEITCMCI